MPLKEVLAGGVLVFILSMIQISKIEINPWSWLGRLLKKGTRALGKIFCGDLLEQMSSMEAEVVNMKDGLTSEIADVRKDVAAEIAGVKEDIAGVKDDVAEVKQKQNEMSDETDMQAAINCRARILRFGDEVLNTRKHTKDHFDSVLRDIKMYEDYCREHDKFENGVTGPTVAHIKEIYKKRLEKNDFLQRRVEEDE